MQVKEDKPSINKAFGLISPCGWGNLGDAAILESMIQAIKMRAPGSSITMLTLNPSDTKMRHGIEAFSLTALPIRSKPVKVKRESELSVNQIRNPANYYIKALKGILREIIDLRRIVSIVRRLNYLIVAGGGQLDDYWGGAWGHPYILFKWVVVAHFFKIRIYFLSVGAGPIDYSLSRAFIRMALSCSTYFSLRDVDSLHLIREIGFRGKVGVKPDLAFNLLRTREVLEGNVNNINRPVIGISPIAYFDPRVWPQKDHVRYNAYLISMGQLIEWLYREGYQVVFFLTQYRHDYPVILDLFELLQRKGINIGNAQEVYCTGDLYQLINIVKKIDLVIASRLHSIIISQTLLKPVIAISYHSKVYALMKEFDLERFCLNIDEINLTVFKKTFNEICAERELLRSRLLKKIILHKRELEDQYEEVFFKSVNSRE